MPPHADGIKGRLTGCCSAKMTRVPAAALGSLFAAGALIAVLVGTANFALWETVSFVKNYGYAVAVTIVLGSCVGVLVWLSFRHRRWWFLCVPSIILWCLVFFLVVGCRVDDGEGGFGFHCATVRGGETIDGFEQRMSHWGHSPATYESEGKDGCATFQGDLDTWFYVYFDSKTRKVTGWKYSSF